MCARIATTDLTRAVRLAETIDDPLLQAQALGWIAAARAAIDKVGAAQLLETAFQRLERHRDEGDGNTEPASIAGDLLAAIEQVAPDRLQESVWRAVSLRSPLVEERGEGSGGRQDAELATSLARYDRAAAAAVLARSIAAFRNYRCGYAPSGLCGGGARAG